MQGYPAYSGPAWYRVRFRIPSSAAGRKLLLYFGAADESAWVWVNGQYAGEHDVGPEGWNKRFAIDITKLTQPGQDNLIAVRVLDRQMAGGLWKSVTLLSPKKH